jgi:hypothetical protein
MMWSLTFPRTNRISGLYNFRSSPEKDFFNTIAKYPTRKKGYGQPQLAPKPSQTGTDLELSPFSNSPQKCNLSGSSAPETALRVVPV